MNEDRVSEKTVAEVAARAGKAFERLVQTMATLRAPGGCLDSFHDLIGFLNEVSNEGLMSLSASQGHPPGRAGLPSSAPDARRLSLRVRQPQLPFSQKLYLHSRAGFSYMLQ